MNQIEQISVSLWFIIALLLAGPAFVGCRFMKEPNSERGKFIRAIFHALWSYVLTVIHVMSMGFTVIPASFYVVLGLVEILSGYSSRQGFSFFIFNIVISVATFVLATFISRMFIKDFYPEKFDNE